MIRYPGESDEYRAARDRLLGAERALRNQVEEVAALRRALPLSGASEDYVFDDDRGEVRLSELFGDKDTLALYSFMYGPAMKEACPMCTSFLDALDGNAHHITQRIALAVAAKSPYPRIRAHADRRGWRRLRLLSSARTSYNRDYHGEDAEGRQLPMMNVFIRRAGRIHHFYGTELLFAEQEPGQDARHIDLMWPVWNVLDLTPGGRGVFRPSLDY
jgi:predicted dithiol-disulfide oxidoreductase (DUF899 family)